MATAKTIPRWQQLNIWVMTFVGGGLGFQYLDRLELKQKEALRERVAVLEEELKVLREQNRK